MYPGALEKYVGLAGVEIIFWSYKFVFPEKLVLYTPHDAHPVKYFGLLPLGAAPS